MRTHKSDVATEVESYLNDPDHLYLNELMTIITCPVKRKRIQQFIDEVANIPADLERIRRVVVE